MPRSRIVLTDIFVASLAWWAMLPMASAKRQEEADTNVAAESPCCCARMSAATILSECKSEVRDTLCCLTGDDFACVVGDTMPNSFCEPLACTRREGPDPLQLELDKFVGMENLLTKDKQRFMEYVQDHAGNGTQAAVMRHTSSPMDHVRGKLAEMMVRMRLTPGAVPFEVGDLHFHLGDLPASVVLQGMTYADVKLSRALSTKGVRTVPVSWLGGTELPIVLRLDDHVIIDGGEDWRHPKVYPKSVSKDALLQTLEDATCLCHLGYNAHDLQIKVELATGKVYATGVKMGESAPTVGGAPSPQLHDFVAFLVEQLRAYGEESTASCEPPPSELDMPCTKAPSCDDCIGAGCAWSNVAKRCLAVKDVPRLEHGDPANFVEPPGGTCP